MTWRKQTWGEEFDSVIVGLGLSENRRGELYESLSLKQHFFFFSFSGEDEDRMWSGCLMCVDDRYNGEWIVFPHFFHCTVILLFRFPLFFF